MSIKDIAEKLKLDESQVAELVKGLDGIVAERLEESKKKFERKMKVARRVRSRLASQVKSLKEQSSKKAARDKRVTERTIKRKVAQIEAKLVEAADSYAKKAIKEWVAKNERKLKDAKFVREAREALAESAVAYERLAGKSPATTKMRMMERKMKRLEEAAKAAQSKAAISEAAASLPTTLAKTKFMESIKALDPTMNGYDKVVRELAESYGAKRVRKPSRKPLRTASKTRKARQPLRERLAKTRTGRESAKRREAGSFLSKFNIEK